MNSTEIRSILRSPYNRENWKNLYRNIFQNKVTFHEEPYQYNVNEDIVESLFQVGYATLDDEYIVALFEVNIKSDVNLLSKKIGLRKIISKYISDDKFNGVLTIFENGSPDYRFTFASKTTKITEEGIEVVETESKRFTYILGGNEPCLTPTQRFESLFKKNGRINLEDIKDAFSVEKLNKEFFNGYKEHYELLCNYFYSIPLKKKFFNDDDKIIRDFVKKFLGRIVFLYFVQKKGWLGVKVGKNWGSGDHLFLSNLYKSYKNKNQFYNKVISKIFFEYLSVERENDLVNLFEDKVFRIPYLNGGLFEKDDVDEFEINFEESYLESLFSFFDRFNFTIYEDDPIEHTIAVDPEMLGHIFENLLEDNKDKGAFYTPKEIVHYMCQESLIEYLTTWFENKGYEIVEHSSFDKPEQPVLFSENESRKGQLVLENKLNNTSKIIDRVLIEKLLKKRLSDSDKNLILIHSLEFHAALDKVKICDPAIGSGAFPMGLLQEIFIAKQTLWNFENESMDKFPASEIKLNIIQNSIYGVDIEKGAVDIARLRFWLSLIVDEDEPKSLPNLDYKIVVGNSLLSLFENVIIDVDWNIEFKNVDSVSKIILNQQNKIYQLEHAQHLFFQSHTNKETLKIQIKKLKIEILKNQLLLTKISFSDNNPILGGFIPTEKEMVINNNNQAFTEKISFLILKLDEIYNNNNLELNYFDWKLNFPEVLNSKLTSNPGFDIVIGNPPYGATLNEIEKDIFKTSFSDVHMRTPDTFNYFISQALKLTKTKGNVSFIVPNNLLFQSEYEKTRGLLIKEYKLIYAVNLGDGVFESATVPSCIFLTQKLKSSNYNKFYFADLRNLKTIKINIIDYLKELNVTQILEVPSFVFGVSNVDFNIIKKIENKSVTINSIALEVASGISTGGDKIFKVSKKIAKELKFEKELLKPVLVGSDIDKYVINDAENILIYSYKKSNTNKFENIYNYLKPFKEKLSQKRETKNGNLPWWCLHWHRYPQLFEGTKIILRQTSDSIRATIDENNYYVLNSILVFKLNENINYDYKFVLAVLNSKVTQFVYKNFTQEEGRTFAEVKPKNVRKLYIPKSNQIIQNVFIKIVNKIFHMKSESKNTILFEDEIDNLMYKLYELNYDEVLIIDPKFSLTNKEYEDLKLL